MTDFQLSPTRGSAIGDTNLQSNSKDSYQVPQNSLASFSKQKETEKYMNTNGEKKNVKAKLCSHQGNVKTSKPEVQQSKVISYLQSDSLDKSSDLPHYSMFYDLQKVIGKKTQNEGENDAAVAILKSDAKVTLSNNLLSKKDVETNTDSGNMFSSMSSVKITPNSSIINMKTSKPDQDDKSCEALSQKMLNVQKMPSVNIRPEFTIQPGPKINIVSSSKTLYKPKRNNAEYFDVVYPPSSPVLNVYSAATRHEGQPIPPGSHMQYVCERHVFPSGKLISGIEGDALRDSHKVEGISVDEKKVILLDLIKSVTQKIEKQASKGNNCCRLSCSLPLLASVVNKIQVDCVKCVEVLNRQLDRLIQLMKEELRSHKALSADHCCQLDETVQYQIVELELMQDENSKQQAGAVKVFKHKGIHR